MVVDLLADIGFGLAGAYGSKPGVAPYKPVDLSEEQRKAILSNIALFPEMAKFGNMYQDYMLAQNEKLLPGYSNILASGARGTQSLLDKSEEYLSGEIPQDVQDAVQRSSAYKAFRGGYQGSQMASAGTARDFGLTSMDLISRGANMLGQGGNSAQQWTSIARGNQVPIEQSGLITPQQSASVAQTNNLLDQAYRQNLFNVEASPDPMWSGISKAVGNSLGQITSVAGLLGSSSGGGGGGGSGGGGGGGGINIGAILGLLSDERLKKNIEREGTSLSGLPIVSFEYLWSPIRYLGVLAQDLLGLGRNDAVVEHDGIYRVRYDLIDVEFVCLT